MEHKTITAESTSDGAGCRDKHRRLTGNNSPAQPVRKNSSLTGLVCHTLFALAKIFPTFFILGLDMYLQVCKVAHDPPFPPTWYS